MWLWLSVASAVLLGLYDVAKKKALQKNGALPVLLAATAISALLMLPFISAGPISDHLKLMLKAVFVTTSWVSGMYALKLLPLTTVSTIKGSRPIFVVIFSIILFGERLNPWQWAGIAMAIIALYLITLTSRKEVSAEVNGKGLLWMALSVVSGVASALYDKHIMGGMQPLFVQCWSNIYITLLLGALMLAKRLLGGQREPLKWDWSILVIAVLITVSDCCYFFALKDTGAMLSVISVLRRASILISFILGAVFFKEKKIKEKSAAMLLMLAGVLLLLLKS